MAIFGYGCKSTCPNIAIVASIIIGVIAAFLRFMAVITVTPAFLWVVFGIAIVYLAILLRDALLSQRDMQHSCVSKTVSVVLAGILGTVLFSGILLAIPFVATSIIGAIVTGILLFFFSLTIASTACLVKQLI